jgi:TRAP-type C4-dicarboxylate transport system permease small subunit
MRIDLLVDALPARIGAVFRLFAELIAIGLTLYLVWGAWGMVDLTAQDRYIALDLSVSWLYFALFAAGLLWLARSLSVAVENLATLVRPAPKP